WRGGHEYFMRFKNGDPEAPLAPIGKSDKTGTKVRFWASDKTFSMTEYDFPTLEHRLRELAFLNSGVTITLRDERHVDATEITMHYDGGVEEFVRYLDRSKTPLIAAPILIRADKEGIDIECAMWWNDSYSEMTLCFTNNIPQRDRGTHYTGFAAALTRVIN